MENKAEKKIDIKKVISIIIAISIISTIFVISCYASVETVEINTEYNYKYIESPSFMPAGNYRDYTGKYIGKAISDNNTIINYNFEFTRIYTSSGLVVLEYYVSGEQSIRAVLYQSSSDKNDDVKGIITFYQIQNDASLNFFKLNLTEHVPMDDAYNESENLLFYSINTVKSLINYMITNNVILIVIAIVIVSFAVGALIRLTRKKF